MNKKENIIDARKLRLILRSKSDFSYWIKKHIRSNDLIENEDFIVRKEEIKALRNKSTKVNYFLTVEAAEKIISNYRKNEVIEKIQKEMKKGISLEVILEQIEKELEIKIIKITDKEYPKELKKIKNPPQQLHVKGNVKILEEPGIAVIGSRDCSIYGRKMCKKFTKDLVEYNLNIISGLASGIDSCAHRSCIEAKGKTIAVLPSGFYNIFPKEHEDLVNKIIEKGGTVITEYPPDFEKTQYSCRDRNRIMSALAIGVLVIEAEKRSGTSITVGYAIEQNKKTFCIPSSLLNSKGVGTNLMIKENRAKLVTDAEDIIKEFPELALKRKRLEEKVETEFVKPNKKKIITEIDEENLEIYNLLSKKTMHINEIAKLTNEPINEITYKLTILELQGAIEKLPGNNFKIK